MQENPFLIFDLDPQTATQSDLDDAYQQKKALYSDDVFKSGEEGAEAARQLSRLQEAYREAKEILASNAEIHDAPEMLEKVAQLIKEGKIDEAQSKLDVFNIRSAEWHYLQSVVYYKRGWLLDSEKQLQEAVTMAPDNEKYKTALKRIQTMKGGDNTNSGNTANRDFQDGRYRSYRAPSADENFTRGMSNCCTNLICLDCCCECMGGDFITCC